MAVFLPITKIDEAKRLVYGTLSEEKPDKTGEILDYASAKPAFEAWSASCSEASQGKSLGNIRAMHSAVAVGKLTDIAFDDQAKRITGVAKIVDADEWQKVLEGVYTGFSIGGGYAKRWRDEHAPDLIRYTPMLSEVSIVDNPALSSATFELIKRDGSKEVRKFLSSLPDTLLQKATAKGELDMDETTCRNTLMDGLEWLSEQVEGEKALEEAVALLIDYLEDAPAPAAKRYVEELAVDGIRKKSQEGTATVTRALQGKIEQLEKRLAHLEAQPMPARGMLKALDKSMDYPVAEVSKGQDNDPHQLMKQALRKPRFA